MCNYYELKVLLPFPVLHDSAEKDGILPIIRLVAKENFVRLDYLNSQQHSSLPGWNHTSKRNQNEINECVYRYRRRAAARLSAFGPSRLVVGSSRASIPQLRQNVSANANRIIREARTCNYDISINSSKERGDIINRGMELDPTF